MPTYSPPLLHVRTWKNGVTEELGPWWRRLMCILANNASGYWTSRPCLGDIRVRKTSPNCVWTQASWLHATVVQNVQSKERRRNMQGNEATWSKYQGWHWRTLWNVGERGCVTACPKVCRGFGVTKSPSRSIRDLIETLGEYEGRASWDGQSSLYNAQPGWPWLTCGRPSIGLSSPDLPIYWPVLPYDLHFVPHTNAPQRDPL